MKDANRQSHHVTSRHVTSRRKKKRSPLTHNTPCSQRQLLTHFNVIPVITHFSIGHHTLEYQSPVTTHFKRTSHHALQYQPTRTAARRAPLLLTRQLSHLEPPPPSGGQPRVSRSPARRVAQTKRERRNVAWVNVRSMGDESVSEWCWEGFDPRFHRRFIIYFFLILTSTRAGRDTVSNGEKLLHQNFTFHRSRESRPLFYR